MADWKVAPTEPGTVDEWWLEIGSSSGAEMIVEFLGYKQGAPTQLMNPIQAGDFLSRNDVNTGTVVEAIFIIFLTIK